MGKWDHIFQSGSTGIREIHPLELFGRLCDCCVNEAATENYMGDRLCAGCVTWLTQGASDDD